MPQPGRRRLPFLHRNWTVGVTASQEWTPQRRPRPPPSAHRPSGDQDGDAYAHPAKRRRVGPALPPVGAGANSLSIGDVIKLPDYPSERANGLRVQLFNVFHQDTPRLRYAGALAPANPSDATRFNARFKVTILSEKCNLPLVVHCAAQIGIVQSHKAENGYGLAKLVLEPFTIPLEQIAILHRDGDVFGLADTYKLRIEIESTGNNDAWPPLDLLALADLNRHGSDYRPKKASDCILYAESNDFFGRPRMRIPLWLRESPQHNPVATKFVMDMDVRWTTGFLERPRKNLNLGVLPTIVALHPDEPLPLPTLDLRDLWPRRKALTSRLLPPKNNSAPDVVEVFPDQANGYVNGNPTDILNGHSHQNGANGHVQSQINSQISRELNGQINGHGISASVVSDDADSAAEDENNENDPDGRNRSLRARRGQKDYNVKAISNKAHNLGSRAPRRRPGSKAFPGLDRYANYIAQQAANQNVKILYEYQSEKVTLDGFVCCMCMATCPDVNQLRAHLLVHLHYTFQYERRSVARGASHIFRVTQIIDDSNAYHLTKHQTTTVYQLGRPTKVLDLGKFLRGDESWVRSRYGPENDDRVVKLAQVPRPKARPAPPPVKRTIIIPQTRQQLYDPLSKALLKAGSVLRTNTVDESWRIHKHREIVQDYTDLTPAEKEFIQEWDRFVILKRIASDAYIPRAMVQFVEERGPWLVGELPRAMEFGKLMAVMVAHDILTDEDVDDITHAMDAAWAEARQSVRNYGYAVPSAASPSSPPSIAAPKPYVLRGGPNCCGVCKHYCSGADAIICQNKACKHRLYHTTCLDMPKVDTEHRCDWYCDDCAHLADPIHLRKDDPV
ncbi:zinc finger domain-containing phd-finger [Ophiostoma piceae UAMH 11346]|uniref:Zinc finger domain-containing phd-finger n=1 Tax=Ophiostoma piceae (strain UAMH 11346) TaxID=1262450 RepID=S3C1N8_OPHP1|nr:zinc finger domain-containing phd-finger [Ophiostoma piceae UAMH 11346]